MNVHNIQISHNFFFYLTIKIVYLRAPLVADLETGSTRVFTVTGVKVGRCNSLSKNRHSRLVQVMFR